MFSTLRTRFGIPGVISVIALVFAMLGGAYAASNNSGGGKATASAKAKRGPRGPKGATGPAGPAGANGANGKDGANGTNGKDGTSVTGTEFAGSKEGHCTEGGVELVGIGKTYACNGKKGKEGSPWTAGGVLPSGATETGTWALSEVTRPGTIPIAIKIPISFVIPLAEPITEVSKIHIFEGETVPAGCTGTVSEEKVIDLGADPGNFCVYLSFAINLNAGQLRSFNPDPLFINKTGKTGAVLASLVAEEQATAAGVWAVTAEE